MSYSAVRKISTGYFPTYFKNFKLQSLNDLILIYTLKNPNKLTSISWGEIKYKDSRFIGTYLGNAKKGNINFRSKARFVIYQNDSAGGLSQRTFRRFLAKISHAEILSSLPKLWSYIFFLVLL